jgi:hypothetical protein
MNPAGMNSIQTLLLAWAVGAVLSRDGSNLHVDAPKGAIPPPLVDALRANKAELLAILPDRMSLNTSAEKGGLA